MGINRSGIRKLGMIQQHGIDLPAPHESVPAFWRSALSLLNRVHQRDVSFDGGIAAVDENRSFLAEMPDPIPSERVSVVKRAGDTGAVDELTGFYRRAMPFDAERNSACALNDNRQKEKSCQRSIQRVPRSPWSHEGRMDYGVKYPRHREIHKKRDIENVPDARHA